mmetsp:Transcript_89272/g.168198  ORF Transcript_89272/g.168198 Transcript_89272/m.168198 type:complete len:183 (-) Transcript_89272:77-625(-)
MENSGVRFGVFDTKEGVRTRKEYRNLLAGAGDTRNRLFGIEHSAGTFNIRSRARSYGAPGVHPRGEYQEAFGSPLSAMNPYLRQTWSGPSRTVTPTSTAPTTPRDVSTPVETAWPRSVKGGFGFAHQPSSTVSERTRKSGTLRPGVAGGGNCTIKDDYHVYYGQGDRFYGSNTGTRNALKFR